MSCTTTQNITIKMKIASMSRICVEKSAQNLVTSQIWFSLMSAKKKREKQQEQSNKIPKFHRKILA